jgi:hypothetical protein
MEGFLKSTDNDNDLYFAIFRWIRGYQANTGNVTLKITV